MDTIDTFLQEIWGEYIAGCIIFGIRFIVRIRTVGLKHLTADDWFALSAFIFYTVDAVVVHLAHVHGTNGDHPNEEMTAVSPSRLQQLALGSKWQLVAWYSYTTLIWSMKGTMVMFYKRLTLGLTQERLVTWLGYVCVVTYFGVILALFFGCRPFSNNWKVYPLPGPECTVRIQNVIIVASFNIATDVALLSVPIPLLLKLKVPRRQKLVVAFFLLTGIMVIAAVVIRVALTLGPDPSTTKINTWGIRETIIAVFAVNLPVMRPLFTRSFWSLRYPPTQIGHSTMTTTTTTSINTIKLRTFRSRAHDGDDDDTEPLDERGNANGRADGGAREQILVEKQVKVESHRMTDEEACHRASAVHAHGW